MKQLEFRARCNHTSELLEQEYNGKCFVWLNEGQDITIEQFTGKLDKKGVKVFEGDKCLYMRVNNKDVYATVVWDNFSSSYALEYVSGGLVMMDDLDSCEEWMEVLWQEKFSQESSLQRNYSL